MKKSSRGRADKETEKLSCDKMRERKERDERRKSE